jgi:hypothetical protein
MHVYFWGISSIVASGVSFEMKKAKKFRKNKPLVTLVTKQTMGNFYANL